MVRSIIKLFNHSSSRLPFMSARYRPGRRSQAEHELEALSVLTAGLSQVVRSINAESRQKSVVMALGDRSRRDGSPSPKKQVIAIGLNMRNNGSW